MHSVENALWTNGSRMRKRSTRTRNLNLTCPLPIAVPYSMWISLPLTRTPFFDTHT